MGRTSMNRRLVVGAGLGGGALGAFAALGGGSGPARAQRHAATLHGGDGPQGGMAPHAMHGGMMTVGEVDHAAQRLRSARAS